MRHLCLAYGNERDWLALTEGEREELSANDEVLRQRGDDVAVLGPAVTVRAWDRKPETTDEPFARGNAPLVGFSIIDAEDIDEVISLVAGTPCAVAKGAIEIHPIESEIVE
ncbi:MAG: YciI family protein [Actinomycetota bacterium]